MSSTEQTTAPVDTSPVDAWRVSVLWAPTAAFAQVRRRPLALATVLIAMAFALLPPLTFLQRVDVAAVVKRELVRSGRLDAIPEAQRAQTLAVGTRGMGIALPVGAAGKRGVGILLVAGLCLVLLRPTRPELKMGPLTAAVGLACAPLVLQDLGCALVFLTKDPMAIDVQNALLSNPAAWLSLDSAHTVAGALLRGVDVLQLWTCGLIGVGVNVVGQLDHRTQPRAPRPFAVWVPYLVAFGVQALGVVFGALSASFSTR